MASASASPKDSGKRQNNSLLGRLVAVFPLLVAVPAIGLVLVTLVLALIKVLSALTIYLVNRH